MGRLEEENPGSLVEHLRRHMRRFHPDIIEEGHGFVWFLNIPIKPNSVGDANCRHYYEALRQVGLLRFPDIPPFGIEGGIEPWMRTVYLREDAEDFYGACLIQLRNEFGEGSFDTRSENATELEPYRIQERVEMFYKHAQAHDLIR